LSAKNFISDLLVKNEIPDGGLKVYGEFLLAQTF
jgi:hypothetical protein